MDNNYIRLTSLNLDMGLKKGQKYWHLCCHYILSSEDLHTMTTKYPAGVMVICVVSSESNVLNRFIAEHTKFNATVNCKVLQDKIIHWMKDKAVGGVCVILQDYNPAHMVEKTQLSHGVRRAIPGKGFVALRFTWPEPLGLLFLSAN